MRIDCYFDDNILFVKKSIWDELKKDQSSTGFRNFVATVTDVIKRHGAFIVYSDKGVMCRCDRLSELEKEVSADD